MKNYLQVYYSEKAKAYTGYPDKLCRYLAERFGISQGSRLIDVGCGRGEFLLGFQRAGCLAEGLDIRRYGGALLEKFKIKTANIERDRFPYEDESFDAVFSKSVIEHLHNPENFLGECQRILKLGGRLIVMTPDWQSQRYVFYSDHTHVQPYVELGLARVLDLYGFKEIETELFYQLPLLWRHPWMKVALKPLRIILPIKRAQGNSFMRWSRELMILGTGIK
ncbi:MAG: methyltransferase domain-containing protein [bacterium]|nr:methyltransferase domain-containing protein [bacterium]